MWRLHHSDYDYLLAIIQSSGATDSNIFWACILSNFLVSLDLHFYIFSSLESRFLSLEISGGNNTSFEVNFVGICFKEGRIVSLHTMLCLIYIHHQRDVYPISPKCTTKMSDMRILTFTLLLFLELYTYM